MAGKVRKRRHSLGDEAIYASIDTVKFYISLEHLYSLADARHVITASLSHAAKGEKQ